MTTQTSNFLSDEDHSEPSGQPARTSRLLKWFNGGAHGISGIVLVYAFIFNGEKSRAMINPVAMKGEVKLGLIVGSIFHIRFIWVKSKRAAGGRWAPASLKSPPISTIRRLTDWAIYLGVAATVVTGLLIAYLRPGAQIIPGNRFFLTHSPALNAAIHTHVFVSNALEWLCTFHVVYFLWFWKIKETRWGRISESWLDRAAAVADRAGVLRLISKR